MMRPPHCFKQSDIYLTVSPQYSTLPSLKERDAWAKHISFGTMEVKEYGRVGCKFASRCAQVMEIGRKVDPPDVQVERRIVKCYLYTEHAEPAAAGIKPCPPGAISLP